MVQVCILFRLQSCYHWSTGCYGSLSLDSSGDSHPYQHILRDLRCGQEVYHFFDATGLNDARFDKLPFSIRILLETAIRNCDRFHVREEDVANILDWQETQKKDIEIPFKPARVLLQDLTGIPVVVDFAVMRDAFKSLGGNPEMVNPYCPTDLVIDHSVQVDFSRTYVTASWLSTTN